MDGLLRGIGFALLFFCSADFCVAEYPNQHTLKYVDTMIRKFSTGESELVIQCNKRMFPLESLLALEVHRTILESCPANEAASISVVYQFPLDSPYPNEDRMRIIHSSGRVCQILNIERPLAIVTVSKLKTVHDKPVIVSETAIYEFIEQSDINMDGVPDRDRCWVKKDALKVPVR